MTGRLLLAVCVGLALTGSARAEQAVPALAFKDVPAGSWQYATVQRLADRGAFTGYPDGTFSGKRQLTRYEFGIAVQTLYSRNVAPLLPPVAATRRALFEAIIRKYKVNLSEVLLPEQDLKDLRRLFLEFQSELEMLGWTQLPLFSVVHPTLENGAQAKIPPRPMEETAAEKRGRQEARKDWTRGTVSLWRVSCFAPNRDLLLLIPVKASGPQGDEFSYEADAYNDEVYRLTLERGWPPNSGRRALRATPRPK